jgi:hypothetical protein
MKHILKHEKDIHTIQNPKLNSERIMRRRRQRKDMFARI